MLEDGSIRVIVELNTAFRPPTELNATQHQNQLAQLTQSRRRIVDNLTVANASTRVLSTQWNAPFMALEVDAVGLQALQNMPQIKNIRLDYLNEAFLTESTAFINAPVVWATQNGTGAGASIVIIDTGVDSDHPFLGGRVVRAACFSSAGTSLCRDGNLIDMGVDATAEPYAPCDTIDPKPLCSHGTHVAGIAAGNGDSFDGVARDANIIAMQVFHLNDDPEVCGAETPPCLRASDIDILNALNHVYELTQTVPSLNIAAVNMSLGSAILYGGACDDGSDNPDDPAGYTELVAQLTSVGVVTVAAAGNAGFSGGISRPACVSNVISVGALDISDPQNPVLADYSNWASAIDFLAPGTDITSSVPDGTFATLSGTSMAAPHVAGAMAIIKGQNPSYTASDVIQTVRLSSNYVLSPDGVNQSLPSLNFQTDIACINSELALRNAIEYANSFPLEVTRLTLCSDITLTAQLPDLSGKLYINGNTYTIFDNTDDGRRGTFRVTSQGHLSMDKLTLSGGQTRGTSGGGSAIVNDGFLMVLNSTFENNIIASCEPGSGLIFQECQGQSSDRVNRGKGSAIANNYFMVLVNSTFDANMNWAAFGGGGAIYNSQTANLISVNTLCRDTNYSANQGQCILNQGNIQSIADTFEHGDDAIADWNGTLSFGGDADNISLVDLNTQCFAGGTVVRRFTSGFTNETNNGNDKSIRYESVDSRRDIALSVYDESGNEIYCNNGSVVRRFTSGFTNDEFVIDIPALDDLRQYTVVLWDVTPYATATSTDFATGFDPLSANATEDVDDAIIYAVDAQQIQTVKLVQPTLNSAVPSANGNVLTWADNDTTETTYLVERTLQTDDTGWQLLATLPANSTSYTDTTVQSGTLYTYRIRAYKFGATTADDQISQPSNAITATAIQCDVCTPIAFRAEAVTDTTVDFSWVDNSTQESTFTLERYNDQTTLWDTVGNASADATTFTDTSAVCETRYRYRLVASGAITAPESSTIDVFTGSCAPTNMSVQNQSDGSSLLRWDDNANTESRYIVEQSTDDGQTWVRTDTLLPNTTYYLGSIITCATDFRLIAERDDTYGDGLAPTQVIVMMPNLCDFNSDGIVSPVDAIQIMNRLGESNTTFDLNADGIISELDVQQVVSQFD